MQKPFEDLIVLDLSRYLLGAYTSLFFADLGAQVIKVEDTKTGDLVRGEMPIVNGESYYHYALNRNKESISLNLKDQEAVSYTHLAWHSPDTKLNARSRYIAREFNDLYSL